MNEQLKPFQQVLVRDSEEKPWSCSFYSYYETKYMVHICTNGRDYKYCIRYEGNEALLGTTDSPKPKRWRAEVGETYWFVNNNGVCFGVCDIREKYDNDRYDVGNYFRTREEAEEIAVKFKAMLKGE